jgi:hypothetical protein
MQAQCEANALSEVMAGRMTVVQMKAYLENLRSHFENLANLQANVANGMAIASSSENMDHYNSIQSSFAYRYVISRDSDFKIARRHNKEFPKFRKGRLPTMS